MAHTGRLREGSTNHCWKNAGKYASDDLLPDAVERQLTIAGEAVSKLADIDRGIAEQLGEYPRIIAFRNQLVHNYPHIDHAAVWSIIQRDVPVLLERVRAFLAAAPPPGPPSA